MIVAFDPKGLERCIHCGLCLEACPTYQITRLETESPRGRLHLMGAMADGRIDMTNDAAALHLDRCLACRACEAVCPSGVPYGRLIEETRAGMAWARGGAHQAVLRPLLWAASRPRVLAVIAFLLRLYHRSGLRSLVRQLLPPGARRLDSLLPPLDAPRYRPTAVAAPTASVALLLGCVMRTSYGDVHTATGAVLASQGIAVVDAPGQTCCGALHAHAGDSREAARLAKLNIAAFERAGSIPVVVNAAGCGAHLKGYVHQLEDDAAWADRAAALAERVRDINEYLASVSADGDLGRLPLRVTYQDPCHLAHAQGVRAEPRALLSRVRGLEVVEMNGADVCCGSAGYYNVSQPEYADRLLDNKIDAILATAPQAVVTANPGCMLQIAAGLRSRGRADIEVLHVVELLDRAMRT